MSSEIQNVLESPTQNTLRLDYLERMMSLTSPCQEATRVTPPERVHSWALRFRQSVVDVHERELKPWDARQTPEEPEEPSQPTKPEEEGRANSWTDAAFSDGGEVADKSRKCLKQ